MLLLHCCFSAWPTSLVSARPTTSQRIDSTCLARHSLTSGCATTFLLQIILPSSHASKTLNNKYDEAWAARRAAAAARTPTQAAAAGGATTASGSVSELGSDTSVDGSCASTWRTDGLNADADSVVGGPLQELWQATGSGARQSGASGFGACSQAPAPALPLHAYSDQVLLLQLEQLTLAAPAAPVLLTHMHEDLSAVAAPSVPVTCEVPLWMQDSVLVQQLIDGSNSIVCGSCTPAPTPQEGQPAQQPGQPASQATAGTAGAAASASAAVQPQGDATQEIQPQEEPLLPQQTPAQQQQQQQAVAEKVGMRHGILLLPEDASLTLTAAPPAPQLRSMLSAAAVKQWFKCQVARLTPRRLVIRPGEAQRLAAAAAAEERAALAAARARAGAARTAAAAAATLSSRQAAAAGLAAAGSGPIVLAAYCLLDFRKLELLAGRMERVQVRGLSPADYSRGSATGYVRASAAGHSAAGAAALPAAPRASGGSLVGLTHMITKTHMRAAVHEFIRPAAVAASVAAGPGPAGPAASAAAAAVPAAPTGCNVVALAATDGLALQLSGWSYQYLMAMVHGNLQHHQNSFEPLKASGPSRAQHTTFNPDVKFGPAAGQLPYFSLTLSSCSIQVST